MLFTKKDKVLVFDAGPIISLTTNNLLWILERIAYTLHVHLMIPEAVKYEVVDVPLNSKKFKYEAIQILKLIERGTLKVMNSNLIDRQTDELLQMANSSFFAHQNPIQLVHRGEVQCLACCRQVNAGALVIDERTTRVLLEDPLGLKKHLENKLHTHINVDKKMLSRFRDRTKGISVLRSAEIIAVAYEHGFLDGLLPNLVDSRELLLDSLLWGVRLQGCAISTEEIERIKAMERQKR